MPLSRREMMRTALASAIIGPTLAAAQETKPTTAATTKAVSTKPATTKVASTKANDRPRFAFVGCGLQGLLLAKSFVSKGDIVAACDPDLARARKFNAERCGGKAAVEQDYRKSLERKDVDAVVISTPEHWHTKHAVDAMRAGKDVYVEKPLTLTIDEGRILSRVVRETSRILQVGSQQRSSESFQRAIAMVHGGYLGKIRHVTCLLKANRQGGPFARTQPPADFNWDMWLGPAPSTPYITERVHYNFRYWYEYAGGCMTNWGAHHVDIAQWAAAPDLPGPTTIEPLEVEHPVPLRGGYATVDDCYNVASRFKVKCTFANGVEMILCDRIPGVKDPDNGILFVGDERTLFVNRREIRGDAMEVLRDKPLPESALTALRNGRPLMSHLDNFLACCRDRGTPISDVWSDHRHLTTCHLANIALRLGRKIQWDAAAQRIVGDDEANAFQRREHRRGYEFS